MSSLYSLLVYTANGLPHLQVDASCELEEYESLFGLANNEWACIGMAAYMPIHVCVTKPHTLYTHIRAETIAAQPP